MAADFHQGKRLQASLYYSGSAVIGQSLRLTGAFLTTARIGKDDFAVYASALMLAGFCNMLRDLGQDPALISLPVLRRGFTRCHLIMSTGLGVLAAVVLTMFIWCTPWFGDLRPIYAMLPGIVLIEAGYHTAQIVCIRRFRFAAIAGTELIAVTSWLAIVFLTIRWLPGIWCLLTAALVEMSCRGIGLCIAAWPDLGPARIRWAAVRYFLRYSKFLTVQSWIQHWSEHIDVLLLRVFGNPNELGSYAQMQQVIGVSFSLSVRSLDQVANAAYNSDQRKPAALRRSVLVFGTLMLGASAIALTIIYLFAILFGATALGLKWRENILDLWWWAVPLCLIRPLMWNFFISFESTSRPSLLLSSVLTYTFLSVLLGILLIVPFGVRGLYVGLAAGQLVTVILQSRWSKELNTSSGKVISQVAEETAV
jgi:O-antigen/teichoic acid export membrane protein